MAKTVLVCVTGCIAAYKSCEIVRGLQKAGVRVKVCMTEHATSFVGPTTFRALTHEEVAVDLFDNPSDPIHHISLAKEPDAVLIAPATANVIAKIAHGEADDLLTTTVLACNAPVVVAPAMNVGMWQADVTQRNIAALEERGYDIVRPISGYLACGDSGEGSLPMSRISSLEPCSPLKHPRRSRGSGSSSPPEGPARPSIPCDISGIARAAKWDTPSRGRLMQWEPM